VGLALVVRDQVYARAEYQLPLAALHHMHAVLIPRLVGSTQLPYQDGLNVRHVNGVSMTILS
jgi:hypothetical protein